MTALAKLGQAFMKCKPIAKMAVKASKNKPELMALSGGACVVTAFILAVKGGMKVKETMVDTASVVEAIEAGRAQKLAVEGISEEEKAEIIRLCNKDLKMARIDGVWKVTKLFLLPGGLLFVGLGLFGGGFKILKERNVVLATVANGALNKLNFYRKNVREDLGEEADLKYLRGMTGDTAEIESVTKDNSGNEARIKRKVPIVKEQKDNPWRFEFSETYFRTWVDDSESNIWFLKTANEYWQHKYDESGSCGISMYEILNYLQYNFDVAKAGMTKSQYRDWLTFLRNYGWKKGQGDDFVDFGLYRAVNEPALLRKTDVLFVEFNCAGNLSEI